MKFSTTLRNTRAGDIITAAGTNPKLKFCQGTETLSPAGGDILATLNITGALGTATSGQINMNETVTQTSSGFTAGTPTFALITTSTDVSVATIAIPGDSFTFTGTIAAGVDITWNASTLTEGNA